MKTAMVSAVPDKPGTIIDPGFVVYTGAALGSALTESRDGAVVTNLISCE